HFEAEVLVAVLDAVDRALAGPEFGGELALGPAAVLPRITDQAADPAAIVFTHAAQRISHMRWLMTTCATSVTQAGTTPMSYAIHDVRAYAPLWLGRMRDDNGSHPDGRFSSGLIR